MAKNPTLATCCIDATIQVMFDEGYDAAATSRLCRGAEAGFHTRIVHYTSPRWRVVTGLFVRRGAPRLPWSASRKRWLLTETAAFGTPHLNPRTPDCSWISWGLALHRNEDPGRDLAWQERWR